MCLDARTTNWQQELEEEGQKSSKFKMGDTDGNMKTQPQSQRNQIARIWEATLKHFCFLYSQALRAFLAAKLKQLKTDQPLAAGAF